MATSVEHAVAYGQLWAALLSRHFALRRYWRADLTSTEVRLVERGAIVRGAGRVEQVLKQWKVDEQGRVNKALERAPIGASG